MTQPDSISLWSREANYLVSAYAHDPAFQERLRVWQKLLDNYAKPGMAALDMGCGSGVFSFYLAQRGLNVIGLDGSPAMLAICEAEKHRLGIENVRFLQGTLPNLEGIVLPQAQLIISSSVLEYIPALDETLELYARLLDPGGILILSMPNQFSIGRNYYRLKYRLRGKPEIYRYIKHFASPRVIGRKLQRYGLCLQESTYYAHSSRVAQLCYRLRLPAILSEDLFTAVLQKTAHRST